MSWNLTIKAGAVVERGIGLRNGANVGPGCPTASGSQPYVTWFFSLWCMDTVFSVSEPGPGGSQERGT